MRTNDTYILEHWTTFFGRPYDRWAFAWVPDRDDMGMIWDSASRTREDAIARIHALAGSSVVIIEQP